MGSVADNPKSKARQKIEVDAAQQEAHRSIPSDERCLRYGQLRGCSHSHRCSDCWFDAGMSPVHKQAEIKAPPAGWSTMELMVEDGISLLASLIHQRQMRRDRDGFPGRQLTARPGGRHRPPDYSNTLFELRGGTQNRGAPNFRIDEFDFSARWNEHIGYMGYQNRPVKGKEWADIMITCIESVVRR